MWEEKKTAGLLRVADPGGTFAGLQTEEPQWRCAFFSPWFLWKQRQKQRKLNEPEDQHAIRKVNEKVCTPSRRWHEHGVASPLLPLCIYFQVSAILSARAERSGRRNTASRKNKSDKQKGKKNKRDGGGKNTRARKGKSLFASYLGDRLLVSHDSLLDERVHFNIPISARHHDPGTAKTHRDFHGRTVRVAWLRAETPRKGSEGVVGGGGGGNCEEGGRRSMELSVSPSLRPGVCYSWLALFPLPGRHCCLSPSPRDCF